VTTRVLSKAGTGVAVLIAAVVWLALTIWVRPLMLPDEGRYVGVAWEMVRSGHWLVPTLDGLPYFHKPPLFYWITAGSMSLFGLHEWAARAAPLLGAIATAASLFAFASRWAGATVARLSLLALVTSPLIFAAAQFANLDMMVAGCISVTILALGSAVLELESGGRPTATLLVAYAFAALGLLAKGLIGIVLPGFVIVVWVLALRRPRLLLSLISLPGLALFAAIGAPWFIAMQQRFPEFLHYFFVVQHFQRYTTTGFNNPEPFWFYFALVPLGFLPWSAWLPMAARASWRNRSNEGGRVRLLMWLWVLLITLFFSMPRSKLIGYILPVCAPVAFLIGDAAAIALGTGTPRTRRLVKIAAALGAALSLSVVGIVTFGPGKSLHRLGEALAQRRAPGEPVVFLHGYYFDIPFYARLREPTPVVDQWDDKALTSHDDWRKELFDAQHFQPRAATPVLVLPSALPGLLCTGKPTWLVGDASMAARYPVLSAAEVVARHRDIVLWRLAPQPLTAAPCRGTPSASSAGM
jgi:4-amino-4-deoxy-L-arabinose transferase-like glycosyltransferase